MCASEDQDLNHLLSDLDHNLGVQEILDDFNRQVTDVHQVDRNEDDNQSIVLGPQPSVTLAYRVSSKDYGVRSVGRIGDGNCSPVCIELLSTECSARDNKRIRLLHDYRLALEHRVRDLMDEVGTLQIEHGQLQYEYRQHGSVVQQLRQDIKQQNVQHRYHELFLQRQLNAEIFFRNYYSKNVTLCKYISSANTKTKRRGNSCCKTSANA